MPIPSPCSFIAAYCDHAVCELRLSAKTGHIHAYVPKFGGWESQIELGTDSFTTATLACRDMGIEPQWD